jgi:hypothetical protein
MSDMQDTERFSIGEVLSINQQVSNPRKITVPSVFGFPKTPEQQAREAAKQFFTAIHAQTLPIAPEKDLFDEALLDGIFASLNQADQRINSTQKSIDALAAETKTMLSQLKELV